MKATIISVVAAIFCGCKPSSRWVERYVPTTEAERKAVAEHVERVMAATPKSLSGHDQDWDDAIAAAHREARISLCRPTLWERRFAGFPNPDSELTGKWKYSTELKTDE